jgi:hypothetical protein
MSKSGPYKQLKVAKSKLSSVLYGMANGPLIEKEWTNLNEAYTIMGKIREAQMYWLKKQGGIL